VGAKNDICTTQRSKEGFPCLSDVRKWPWEQAFALQYFFRFGQVRAKLLRCSKNEANVSYLLKSGPSFL
jgi:hypothetical protein